MLNCDLGENESAAATATMMGLIDAANIGCGVHAGSEAKTEATLEVAREMGVRAGAHPGLAAAGGRGGDFPRPAVFAELLRRQVGRFLETADRLGVRVTHVKLHGTLYHAVETDGELAEVYLRFLVEEAAGLETFSMADGAFAAMARAAGVTVRGEVFADRGYLPNGRLLPRGRTGSVLDDPEEVVARLRRWRRSGRMGSIDGGSFPLRAETVCVHSDSPGSESILRALRAVGF